MHLSLLNDRCLIYDRVSWVLHKFYINQGLEVGLFYLTISSTDKFIQIEFCTDSPQQARNRLLRYYSDDNAAALEFAFRNTLASPEGLHRMLDLWISILDDLCSVRGIELYVTSRHWPLVVRSKESNYSVKKQSCWSFMRQYI
jgi:hypothetical protein